MNILITGGTGFIGSQLTLKLHNAGNTVYVTSRSNKNVKEPAKYLSKEELFADNIPFDTVINLAGEPIADKRWSDKQKSELINSRLNTTQLLIDYFKQTQHKPASFISGSAIGYYGLGKSSRPIDETCNGDNSFSSHLCQTWENTALQATDVGIRTCLIRTGIVLGENGGALKKMLLPFKLGLGGKIGDGTQWMPWIHIDDIVGLICFCVENPKINGAVNGTAPFPVTNYEFSNLLGKVLKRPLLLPFPAFAIKILMGKMGEELLLSGKKVVPTNALNHGYRFIYKDLSTALNNIIN